MAWVEQAVLEFDEAVQAPWRPRLVSAPAVEEAPHQPAGVHASVHLSRSRPAPTRPVTPRASRPRPVRPPSRVGACRPRTHGDPAGVSHGTRGSVVPPARETVAARARGELPVRPGPRRSPRGGLRLTPRARRLAFVLALAGGVALGSWLAPLLSGGPDGLHLAGVSSVVVEPGDTLWSIASSVAGDDDVRAVVDEIQRLNGLESADVVPGQVLRLP